MKAARRIVVHVLAIVAIATSARAQTVLLQEDFNGTVNDPVNGWNGWSGDSNVVISSTVIDQGNSAVWSGGTTWPGITKTFAHTPVFMEDYILTATLSASSAGVNEYADVRLATAAGNYVYAAMGGAEGGVLRFSDGTHSLTVSQTTTMDVRVLFTPAGRTYCFYRTHGDSLWSYAGYIATDTPLASFDRVKVYGHATAQYGYAGNVDSINVTAQIGLLREDFNGTVGNSVSGWNEWTGDSNVHISNTVINQGNSAGWASGTTWPCIMKVFYYALPTYVENYVLTATLSASSTGGDYADLRLGCTDSTDYIGAAMGGAEGGVLRFSNGTDSVSVPQSSTMDVKISLTWWYQAQCYYRNHGANEWNWAGAIAIPRGMGWFDCVKIYGHAGYAGNIDSIRVNHEPALSHGRQVILNRGLQIQSLVFPDENPGFGGSTGWLDRWESANFTTVNYFNHWEWSTLPSMEGGQQWGRMCGYLGDGYAEDSPEEQALNVNVSERGMTFINNLANLQYGDEVRVTEASLNKMRTRFAAWKASFPNTLVHTDFGDGAERGVESTAQLRYYMQYSYPDMLLFCNYPGYNFAGRNAWYTRMQQFRTVALEGYDGTGSLPIVNGQFLYLSRPNWNSGNVPSESFVRLQQFASWAFGYTFVSAYLYNDPVPATNQSENPVMFNAPGDADVNMNTTVFNYVAAANFESKNLGPELIRLKSTDIRFRRNAPSGSGISNCFNAGNPSVPCSYLTNVDWTPADNNRDLLVGFFEPLPIDNADNDFINSPATGATKYYLMVVNGAASGTATASQKTARLTFNIPANMTGYVVRKYRTSNGSASPVTLAGGGVRTYDLVLPGGTGGLLKFYLIPNP